MKTIRRRALAEFQIRCPQNRLVIESVEDDEVVIRAAVDNFAEWQKSSFIRYLAVEGFIPAHFCWVNPTSPYSRQPVRWVIDAALTDAPEESRPGKASAFVRTAAPLFLFFSLWLVCVACSIFLAKLCLWP